MRIELHHMPQHEINRLLNSLHAAIAEERLPIPVDVVQSTREDVSSAPDDTSPHLRIFGYESGSFDMSPVRPESVDDLQQIVRSQWNRITVPSALR